MFSPESKTFSQIGKVQAPSLPGLEDHPDAGSSPNPFKGIRRAGQAKREQSFMQFNASKFSPVGGEPGAQAKTLVGSMKPEKY